MLVLVVIAREIKQFKMATIEFSRAMTTKTSIPRGHQAL
jgi:hypothetical protein